ncbi:MAG: PilZ domain-containing protein [Candidatus Omnitrophota bacterium]|nr:PilZ domain-containing protein [Candidatus Omnitrophota bacterium]
MQADYSEQRRFPRFGYSIPLKYRQDNQNTPTYTVTRDISVGGLKLLTNNFIPRGTEIQIEVELPHLDLVNTSATVVWSSRINHSEEYLSGIRFTELNETSKGNITDLVSYALRR